MWPRIFVARLRISHVLLPPAPAGGCAPPGHTAARQCHTIPHALLFRSAQQPRLLLLVDAWVCFCFLLYVCVWFCFLLYVCPLSAAAKNAFMIKKSAISNPFLQVRFMLDSSLHLGCFLGGRNGIAFGDGGLSNSCSTLACRHALSYKHQNGMMQEYNLESAWSIKKQRCRKMADRTV